MSDKDGGPLARGPAADAYARAGGDDEFARMKADGAGRIEEFVKVMGFMEAPQDRRDVIEPMPDVNPQIEEDEIEDEAAYACERLRPFPRRGARGPQRDRHCQQRTDQRALRPERAVMNNAREPMGRGARRGRAHALQARHQREPARDEGGLQQRRIDHGARLLR